MNWDEYLRAMAYLLLVLGLIALCTWLVRLYGGPRPGSRGRRRLSVVESISVDPRRRMVLVRRDDTEHLLLLGPVQDLVIETGIGASERFEPTVPDNAP